MARSFGMDICPTSTRWTDIVLGPSKKQVAAHLAKVHYYATHPEYGPGRQSR